METPEKMSKYTILRKLKEMTGTFRINYYLLCAHVDISIRTLDNWVRIPADSTQSIPESKFYQIAEFLNCKPEELKNIS